MTPIMEYRVSQLEKETLDIEQRLRAVEVFQAKIIGWSAGAAFAGSAVFQLVQWMVK